jgi:hypothetical protein
MRKLAPTSLNGRMLAGNHVNARGLVAGRGAKYLTPTLLSNTSVAFRGDLGFIGPLADLPGRPPTVTSDDSEAYGINDNDDSVGWTFDAIGPKAVVWGYGFWLKDLNTLIVSCDPLRTSVVLTEARAINNKREIAATGSIAGTYHAFVLKPVSFWDIIRCRRENIGETRVR